MTRLVLTIGTFDVPHMGHAAFLRECERYGDRLVVGVNSDAFVERYKGATPTFTQDERLRLVGALGYDTLLNDGPGRDLVLSVGPQVLAIGTDWAPPKDYYAQIDVSPAELHALGVALVFIPMRPAGISATEIKRRLA